MMIVDSVCGSAFRALFGHPGIKVWGLYRRYLVPNLKVIIKFTTGSKMFPCKPSKTWRGVRGSQTDVIQLQVSSGLDEDRTETIYISSLNLNQCFWNEVIFSLPTRLLIKVHVVITVFVEYVFFISSFLLLHFLNQISIFPSLLAFFSTSIPLSASHTVLPCQVTWLRLSAFFCFTAGGAVIKACQWETWVALSHALCLPSVNSPQPSPSPSPPSP